MDSADGGNPTKLTNIPSGAAKPAFSPDGTKIAFQSAGDGTSEEVYVMDSANGRNQTRLTNNPARDVDPAFSPDGTKIAFMSLRNGNQEIYVMDSANGGNQTNLTNNGVSDTQPDWQPIPRSAPPVANDDTYGATEDVTLSVPAPGVLANDTDPENDPLTAIKLSDPSHGTLTLDSDGSFTYTPDGGFAGDDSFTYKANDGTSDSNTATAKIKVDDRTTPPTVTGATPADKATKVARNANVTATFSKAMDPATLTGSTVKLEKVDFRGSTTPVQATVTLSSDGRTVTLDPSTNLGASATYRATIKGGSSGAKDLAGNPLAADKVWSFKTGFR